MNVLTCPDCRRELRPTANPRLRPVVVSCQCGAQLLCRLHPRRAHRLQCVVLRTPEQITEAWDLVRAATGEVP